MSGLVWALKFQGLKGTGSTLVSRISKTGGILPRFISEDQAAKYWGTCTNTFRKFVRDGVAPPPIKIPGFRNNLCDRLAQDAAMDRLSGIERDHGAPSIVPSDPIRPGPDGMRTRLPPNVERNRVKNRNYYYFRIGKGARIRLPDDIQSEEFRAAYAAAMAGKTDEPKLRKDAPGTIGALIESNLRSAAFIRLKEIPKTNYMSRLSRIREDHGNRNVSGMTRERIIAKILEPFAECPAAAQDTPARNALRNNPSLVLVAPLPPTTGLR